MWSSVFQWRSTKSTSRLMYATMSGKRFWMRVERRRSVAISMCMLWAQCDRCAGHTLVSRGKAYLKGKTTLARRVVELLSMEPSVYTVREFSVAACGDDNALLQQLIGDTRRKVRCFFVIFPFRAFAAQAKNLSEVEVARLGLSSNTTNILVVDDFDQLLLACPSALRIIERLMGQNEVCTPLVGASEEQSAN